MRDYFDILLRRKNAIYIQLNDPQHVQSKDEAALLVSGLANLEELGFELSPAAMQMALHLDKMELLPLLGKLGNRLRIRRGYFFIYRPMYPNFPKQVADADYVELYLNAIGHYITDGYWTPEYHKKHRKKLKYTGDMETLQLGKKEEVGEIVTNLLSANTSLSAEDYEDVESFFALCQDYVDYIPEVVPFKETAAFVAAMILKYPSEKANGMLGRFIHTATDVLRLITIASGGTADLSVYCNYKCFSRPARRQILRILNDLECNLVEDMFRYRQEWLRIGEILHPFEHKGEEYRKVYEAFDILRNRHKPRFFNTKVEDAVDKKDVESAIVLLKARPGEFARRLDKLLRDNPDQADKIAAGFAEVATKVATPLLLHVKTHFEERNRDKLRAYMPKGAACRMNTIPDEVTPLAQPIADRMVAVCADALHQIYAERPKMGKVYVDKALKNYVVPFSQRSASDTSMILTRGSRLPIDRKAKVIRSFIWWTNDEHNYRVDIDLSAAVLDENFGFVRHVSYTRLRDTQLHMYHSGDVVNGGDFDGEGVSEFLDIDIKAVGKNARYVAFCVFSYTQQPFSQLPHACFGWMQRQDLNSGEVYEPKAVKMKMDLTANSNSCLPVLFDCKKREFVWCDLAINSRAIYNAIEFATNSIGACSKAIVTMAKPNMYDLVVANASARGELVDDPAEADVVFGTERVVDGEEGKLYVSPFDLDYYMSNLL